MRPHRARMVYSLLNSYDLTRNMVVHRPEARSFEQLTEYHADGGCSACVRLRAVRRWLGACAGAHAHAVGRPRAVGHCMMHAARSPQRVRRQPWCILGLRELPCRCMHVGRKQTRARVRVSAARTHSQAAMPHTHPSQRSATGRSPPTSHADLRTRLGNTRPPTSHPTHPPPPLPCRLHRLPAPGDAQQRGGPHESAAQVQHGASGGRRLPRL